MAIIHLAWKKIPWLAGVCRIRSCHSRIFFRTAVSRIRCPLSVLTQSLNYSLLISLEYSFKSRCYNSGNVSILMDALYDVENKSYKSTSWCHHHHHRQPWAQCPLVSDAIVTIAAQWMQINSWCDTAKRPVGARRMQDCVKRRVFLLFSNQPAWSDRVWRYHPGQEISKITSVAIAVDKLPHHRCQKQVIWAKLTWRAIAAVLPLWQSVYSLQ